MHDWPELQASQYNAHEFIVTTVASYSSGTPWNDACKTLDIALIIVV